MFGDTDLIFSDSRTKEQKQIFLGWLQSQRRRPLLVIEVGCGTSMHSLRVEAEALVQRRPQTRLVRINPAYYDVRHSLLSASFAHLHLHIHELPVVLLLVAERRRCLRAALESAWGLVWPWTTSRGCSPSEKHSVIRPQDKQ
jgi:hypothetical protein